MTGRQMSHRRLHLIVPAAYILLALVLGVVAPRLGERLLPGAQAPLAPDSAIALLSAIASGMMALTGIAFSASFVFSQLSSSAYTPRLFAEFGRSRLTPHALGVFVGTFLYAALAIRAVGLAGRPGVHASVTWIALGWLLASVVAVVLVIGRLRQFSVSEVLADLGEHGLSQLRYHYRPYAPDAENTAALVGSALDAAGPAQVIAHTGAPLYLVQMDVLQLSAAARDAAALVVVPFAVGDAVMPGDVLAVIRGGSRRIDEAVVRSALALSRDRTIENNAPYALRLLVDIAIRALSPAINDPTTAVAALDQIEALLRAFGNADLECGAVRDRAGTLRVAFVHPSWEDLLSLGLCEIAQYGQQSIQVQRRLGALLSDLVGHVPPARRTAVEQWRVGHQRALAQAPFSEDALALACCRDRQGLGHTLPR